MNRDDFKRHVATRIEGSIGNAEDTLGVTLPLKIVFQWMSPKGEKVSSDVAEEVTRVVFLDEDNIYPCVRYRAKRP